MNILQTIAARDWGGIAYRTVEQTSWLNRNGHSCWLACPPDSAVYLRARLAGVPALEFDFDRPLSPGTIMALRRLINRLNCHVIESHTGRCANAAIFGHDLCALVRTRHTTQVLKPSLSRVLRGRFAWDWTVATADVIADTLLNAGLAQEDRLEVIGEWAEPRFFQREAWPGWRAEWRKRLGVREHEFVIGAVGMLRPEKGFEILLRAMALLRRQYPHFRAIIVGGAASDSNHEDRLHNLGGELALGDAVRFVGYQEDIPGLLQAFDVVAVPSVFEAQSRVIPEALASERPVVASGIGGIGELIHHGRGGWLVKPGDAPSLASRLEQVHNHAARTAEICRAAGQMAAQHLNIDGKMHAYLAVYEAARDRRKGLRDRQRQICAP